MIRRLQLKPGLPNERTERRYSAASARGGLPKPTPEKKEKSPPEKTGNQIAA